MSGEVAEVSHLVNGERNYSHLHLCLTRKSEKRKTNVNNTLSLCSTWDLCTVWAKREHKRCWLWTRLCNMANSNLRGRNVFCYESRYSTNSHPWNKSQTGISQSSLSSMPKADGYIHIDVYIYICSYIFLFFLLKDLPQFPNGFQVLQNNLPKIHVTNVSQRRFIKL